jgi:hypothetical protein
MMYSRRVVAAIAVGAWPCPADVMDGVCLCSLCALSSRYQQNTLGRFGGLHDCRARMAGVLLSRDALSFEGVGGRLVGGREGGGRDARSGGKVLSAGEVVRIHCDEFRHTSMNGTNGCRP